MKKCDCCTSRAVYHTMSARKYVTTDPVDYKPPSHAAKLAIEYGNLTKLLGKPFKIFPKYVKLFDLYFVATKSSSDDKLLHGATVLYQYIDNNDDGIPDNELVYSYLVKNKATMVMFRNQKEITKNSKIMSEIEQLTNIIVLDLEANETRPGSLAPFSFDEALEECFHFLTAGYSLAYPDVFNCKHGSVISLMMDCARGGYFKNIPKKYPDGAWFTYYDKTCDYESMVTEYMYWAMTTILGAQQYRRCEIQHDWQPCTLSEIKIVDHSVFQLLTNPIYMLPSKLPVPVATCSLDACNTYPNRKSKEYSKGCCMCCAIDLQPIKKHCKKFRFAHDSVNDE